MPSWLITLLLLPVTVPAYYWNHRVELWESFIDEIPFVTRPQAHSVEIWLRADRSCHGGRWEAKLPARCVTCGKWGSDHEMLETRTVDDHSTPALTAFLGLLVGALASHLMSRWKIPHSILAFPLGLFLGSTLGYLMKNRSQLVIKFFRCRAHVADRKLPRARVLGDHLIIRVGNREVRKDFREPEQLPAHESMGWHR